MAVIGKRRVKRKEAGEGLCCGVGGKVPGAGTRVQREVDKMNCS